MNDSTTLTEHELILARQVGEWRYQFVLDHRLRDDPGDRREHSAEWHVRGVECEMAASFLLNIYWRPQIGILGGIDIGGLVNVRSTILRTGRLIIRADDKDAPTVLVEKVAACYTLVGWFFSGVAKLKFAREDRYGAAAHYVPRGELHPLSTLREWIKEARDDDHRPTDPRTHARRAPSAVDLQPERQ